MNREEARELRKARAKESAREANKEGRKMVKIGIGVTAVLLFLLFLMFRNNLV